MAREYDIALVDMIKQKEIIEKINGIDVVVKNIPDSDIVGAMDPRSWKQMKWPSLLMKVMPKKMFNMDYENPKTLARLRKMFNNVDSTPVATTKINKFIEKVGTEDGQTIDIHGYYRDDASKDSPILYYIHGGGFFAGSTDVVNDAMELLVEKYDIVVYSINYRLAPENPYPIGHQDTYSGLKWIYNNADKYCGNKDMIFVAGDSAGGNLTQYCTTRDLEEKANIVKGQLLLYPTVNMAGLKDEYTTYTPDKYNVYRKHARAIDFSINAVKEDKGIELGPILNVADVNNKYLSPYGYINDNNPPTFISVGEHDFLTLESLGYARKISDTGTYVKTVLYRGLGHAYLDKIGYLPQSEDIVIEMGEFIIDIAKKQK